jgi:hypothetical protein
MHPICRRLVAVLILASLGWPAGSQAIRADDVEAEDEEGAANAEEVVAQPESAQDSGRGETPRGPEVYLRQKIATIDLLCRLSNAQKEKLQLAGKIDLARRLSGLPRPEKVDEADRRGLRRMQVEVLHSAPIDDGSFFSKVLKSTLTNAQRVRCEALLTGTARVTGFRFRGEHEDPEGIQDARFPGTSFGDGDVLDLRAMSSLESLDLESTAITDAAMTHLRGLANLEELDLGRTQIGDRGVANLKELRSLKRLRLGGTQITDAGLSNIRQLELLNELDLHETRIDGSGLAALERLQSLRILNLRQTQVTDQTLSLLQNYAGLERLNLRGTTVTDAGMVHLKSLVNLRELNLGDTQITDAGLANLLILSKLEVLDLRNTKVSDRGLASLLVLPTLRHLYLFDTDVSDDAVAEFLCSGREVRVWR